MSRIQADDQEEALDGFQSLTANQARELRNRQPLLSYWRVVLAQVLIGCVLALVVWLITKRLTAVYSVGYGALAATVPTALFVRGLTSPVASVNAGAAVFGFFLWESVKIGLTVAMLFAAPHVVKDLSWPAMLVGLVVTMKVYWVTMGLRQWFYPMPRI